MDSRKSRPIVAFVLGIGTGIMLAFIMVPTQIWNIGNSEPESVSDDLPIFESIALPPQERRKCNSTGVDALNEEVRVLCWVMTNPKNHETKAAAVNITWGQHCTILMFISSQQDDRLPTVALKVKEGRNFLWDKTRGAFRHIINNGYLDQVDWVLKADDDTFVVMENLRSLLRPLNSSEPLFLGLRLKNHNKDGFLSGGAGYVLSREAARSFVSKGLPSGHKLCLDRVYHFEDVAMAQCMSSLKIPYIDTRDELGMERFYAYTLENQMAPVKKMNWLKKQSYFPLMPGSKCCSTTAISFHYITPEAMRAMYYLIYKLQVSGRTDCSE